MTSKNDDFKKLILEQANAYGVEFARVLSIVSELKDPLSIEVGELNNSLEINADFIASILFVGTVTGEFIVSVTQSQAKELFPSTSTQLELEDLFKESLNMAAGSRVGPLSKLFEKLTITPPKIFSGKVKYPTVKNVPVILHYSQGSIQTYFYVDKMRLDIAQSYREVISALQITNEELKHVNDKLKDQQAQLVHSEKMASLGVMAAGVAHEINNPLAFVVSNTDVLNSYVDAMRTLLIGYDHLLQLLSEGKSDEAKSEFVKISEIKRKEDLSFILQDTRKLLAESKFGLERIRGIVNGLKRFSRVNDTEIKKVDLNEEIKNTLMMLQNEIKYNSTVELDLKAKNQIECLPAEINQVFMNFILNASQAMGSKKGLIRIQSQDIPEGIKISVKDNGTGIPQENLEKLFTPFFTTKPVGEGTGLGLAISHGIIQKHMGKIYVHSTLGQGTEFIIELPSICKIKDPTQKIKIAS